ncbi:MAG: C-GCAxxG-C-C family protein [Kiritimatiellia bacterium]
MTQVWRFQATSSPCAPLLIQQNTSPSTYTHSGGGMGRMAQTCGAVTGAYMVVGLKYGAATGDREAKEKTYRLVRECAAQFRAKNGSLACKDLLDETLDRWGNTP